MARPTGTVLVGLALSMLACSVVGPVSGDAAAAWPLVASAAITALVGAGLVSFGKREETRIGRREALVMVSASWFLACMFGGLPFVLGAGMTPWDAFFESVSGFTTTGASILTDIEGTLNQPLHLWRLLTHWLGGLGIVVLFVALFPALGVGGKHLFRTESAGPQSEGIAPRIRETASAMWKVYAVLTAILVGLLLLLGMNGLEALGHAFATMGTGGFSTRNASIAAFESPGIEVVLTLFMFIAGANIGLIHEAVRHGPRLIWRNAEFRAYLTIFLIASLLITTQLAVSMDRSVIDALRHASFQVSSIMTTTGFMSDDYEQWPVFSQAILASLFFFGGSAGSTAGGIKIIRLLIVLRAIQGELRRGFRPTLIAPVRVGDQVVLPHVVAETLAFSVVYVMTVVAGGLLVALFDEVDLLTAATASLTCVANVGPGFGMIGPTENFAFFSAPSKVVLSLCMLLGRLEFFTLLALLVPSFWRR